MCSKIRRFIGFLVRWFAITIFGLVIPIGFPFVFFLSKEESCKGAFSEAYRECVWFFGEIKKDLLR